MRSARSVCSSIGLALLIGLGCSVATAQPVTTSDLENAAADNSSWLTYGRDYYGQRFARLGQITPANVNRLHPAWVFATGGDNRGLQATPLIHEGVLYLSRPINRACSRSTRARARRNGATTRRSARTSSGCYCCGSNNRGVALWGDLVFVGTMDARLIALNKDTGAVVWETKVIDWEQGYSITGAPLVVKDMVLTGVAGGEFGIRGFVKAFDAKTGALRWTAYTIPGPGEPGNETWPGDTWKNGGGPTWTTGVYDPKLNLVYWNTGNAAPWNCHVRKGDNKWTASTIALDADTGKIEWGFQYTPWDCWDYDAVSTPVLADVALGDKGTGEGPLPPRQERLLLRARSHEREVPLRRAHRPRHQLGLRPRSGDRPPQGESRHGGADRAARRSARSSRASKAGSTGSPSPTTRSSRTLYFMSNQWAMGMKFWAEGKFKPPTNGEWYLGADYQQYLTSEHPGNFVAFDVVQRKVVWRAVSPAPFWAGAVATSTGLVFTGDMRGYFMALDARSGDAALAVPDGLGNHRQPDHLRARRHAVRRRALRRHRRRHDLLLQGAQGREPLGLRPRWRRRERRPRRDEPDHPRGRAAQGRRAGQYAGRPRPPRVRLSRHAKAASRSRGKPLPQPTSATSAGTAGGTDEAARARRADLSRALLRLPPGRRRQRPESLPDHPRALPGSRKRWPRDARARPCRHSARCSRRTRSGRSTTSSSRGIVCSSGSLPAHVPHGEDAVRRSKSASQFTRT